MAKRSRHQIKTLYKTNERNTFAFRPIVFCLPLNDNFMKFLILLKNLQLGHFDEDKLRLLFHVFVSEEFSFYCCALSYFSNFRPKKGCTYRNHQIWVNDIRFTAGFNFYFFVLGASILKNKKNKKLTTFYLSFQIHWRNFNHKWLYIWNKFISDRRFHFRKWSRGLTAKKI